MKKSTKHKSASMTPLKISKPFWQVLTLGVLAGMRATSALVIASYILSRHQSKSLSKSPFSFIIK